MKFPRPEFSPEQVEQAYDMQALVSPFIEKAAKAEREAIVALLDIAEADETKPGIKVSGEYSFDTEKNTYVYEQTVAFDTDVPRGEVHIAPATGWGIGPYQP